MDKNMFYVNKEFDGILDNRIFTLFCFFLFVIRGGEGRILNEYRYVFIGKGLPKYFVKPRTYQTFAIYKCHFWTM